MGFKMKYEIKKDYLPVNTKRRSGEKINKVLFIVLHDTGNDGSTAHGNVNYYKNSANAESASAHIFVDDKDIIECIPAFENPEKAWHVLYDRPLDNKMFGDDANDAAIGVELCYSYKKGNINNEEAYKRYIWVVAYLCYRYGLNPQKHLVGHCVLDPQRKTDPVNAVSKMGKTYEQLINDITKEYNECISAESNAKQNTNDKQGVKLGEVVSDVWLHNKPDTDDSSRVRVLKQGERYKVYGEKNGMYDLGGGYFASKKYIKIIG
jgi:N-acetylmuramoyl-L-alanine amidase